jgi:hypothetical protein
MTATLRDVMKFFEETSSKKFSEEWKQLTIEEKEWFKQEVGKVINKVDEE